MQWTETINKMRSAYGAPISAGQVDELAAYLRRTESSCITVLHQSSFKLSNCSARKSISVLTDGNNPRREAKTA
jgi:hypothetical protein